MSNSVSLYIGGLTKDSIEGEILKLFQAHGKVLKLNIKSGTNGAKYAFLEYEDPNSNEKAIQALDKKEINGE